MEPYRYSMIVGVNPDLAQGLRLLAAQQRREGVEAGLRDARRRARSVTILFYSALLLGGIELMHMIRKGRLKADRQRAHTCRAILLISDVESAEQPCDFSRLSSLLRQNLK